MAAVSVKVLTDNSGSAGETAGLRTHPPPYPREPQDPGWVLPFKRLMGMCCWIESHFHGWIDYNGVANFSSDFWGKKVPHIYG